MTYIIAEVGSNYEHFDDCTTSIALAKKAGANAVKFQLIQDGDLHFKAPFEGRKLPVSWISDLAHFAKQQEIDFLCSAFSAQSYVFLDTFVPRHKIASCELSDPTILKTVASFKKPIILSTADASWTEIESAIEHILGVDPDGDITLLYCVGLYPAPAAKPGTISAMRLHFDREIGYSDHVAHTDYYALAAATQHKATVIEKHVNFVRCSSDDSPHSIEFDRFQQLCSDIRAEKEPSLKSQDFHDLHKRRWLAAEAIPAGTPLEGRVVCKRSTIRSPYFSPLLYKPEGKTASRDYQPGEPIEFA